MKPLVSYADVKRPRKPKPKGWERFPLRVVHELREFVRGLPSIIDAGWGPVEAAHVTAKGTGAGDWDNLIPLRLSLHRELHRIGIRSFEYKYDVRLKPLARKVTAAFLKTYPEMRKRRAAALQTAAASRSPRRGPVP